MILIHRYIHTIHWRGGGVALRENILTNYGKKKKIHTFPLLENYISNCGHPPFLKIKTNGRILPGSTHV
jgi:hypothetical protein